jgi:hypothetical protein
MPDNKTKTLINMITIIENNKVLTNLLRYYPGSCRIGKKTIDTAIVIKRIIIILINELNKLNGLSFSREIHTYWSHIKRLINSGLSILRFNSSERVKIFMFKLIELTVIWLGTNSSFLIKTKKLFFFKITKSISLDVSHWLLYINKKLIFLVLKFLSSSQKISTISIMNLVGNIAKIRAHLIIKVVFFLLYFMKILKLHYYSLVKRSSREAAKRQILRLLISARDTLNNTRMLIKLFHCKQISFISHENIESLLKLLKVIRTNEFYSTAIVSSTNPNLVGKINSKFSILSKKY